MKAYLAPRAFGHAGLFLARDNLVLRPGRKEGIEPIPYHYAPGTWPRY